MANRCGTVLAGLWGGHASPTRVCSATSAMAVATSASGPCELDQDVTMNSAPGPGRTGFMERLRTKWGVDSYLQVVAILLVFSLTGMTVVMLRKTLFTWLGYDEHTAFWLKTVTYLAFIFPAYQILILVYGAIFGQFRFFWQKQKRLGRAIARPFRRANTAEGRSPA